MMPPKCPPEILHIMETLLQACASTKPWRCAVVIYEHNPDAEALTEVIPGFSYMPRNATDEHLIKRFPAAEFSRLTEMLEVAADLVSSQDDVEIRRHKVGKGPTN